MYAKTINEWIAKNKNGYNFYYTTYPFLQTIGLPVSLSTLKEYYISDSHKRNVAVNNAFLENYEMLFDYFCANYNNNNKFVANTWLENIITSIPKGIDKTFSDIGDSVSSVLDTSKYIIFLALLVAIIFLYGKIK